MASVLLVYLLAAPPLTLSAVLADVEARSPILAAEQDRVAALRNAADAVGAWDDPFLAVGPDELSLEDPMPSVRAQLSQVIPFPGKRGARAQALKEQAEAAHAMVSRSARELRVAATQVFLRALYLQRARATNAALQQAVREVQASASARYVTGGSVHHDALLADAELAVLARDALVLTRAVRAAFVSLDELRGRTPHAATEIPELVDDVTLVVPASLDDALASQPELAAAYARVRAAESDARARDLAAWPDLTVQVMWMQSFMPDEPSNGGAMLGVSLPIFAPWKQHALSDAATRQLDAEKKSVEVMLLRLRAEWEQAQQDLASAEETARLYADKILPTTRLALDSAGAAYASKEAPLFEVLSIIRALHQASLEAEAAAIDVKLARLRLQHLLTQSAALRLAPAVPTLFGGGMSGGMGGSAAGMGAMPMASTPLRMGAGMAAPAPGLMSADEASSGMGGM